MTPIKARSKGCRLHWSRALIATLRSRRCARRRRSRSARPA